MIHNTVLILLLGFLFSCNRNFQLEDFIGQTVKLPDSIHFSIGDKDIYMPSWEKFNKLKLIIWYDSLGCSSCRISKINEWKPLIDSMKFMEDYVKIIFIFTPTQYDKYWIKESLMAQGFNYPILVDYQYRFLKRNPWMTRISRKLHTFLLDEDNCVILAGNPISNRAMCHLYKTTIDSLFRMRQLNKEAL